jgi:TonB-linked SusC/RagA family outer membrane protein
MLKKNLLTILLTFFAFIICNAQTKRITGKVVSSDNSTPLAGVTISLKGSKVNAVSSEEGTFSLNAPTSNKVILSVSSIGYITKEVDASVSNNIEITLEPATKNLDEVVVVGYGTQKKRDVTGSVSTISKERLQQLPNTNIAEALQGSIPGLQINTNGGGAEDNNLTILVRGRNSISASNSPLIIWDGIPFVGGISEINPNDVESIEVLKDASAVAIYGSRGSNGVILITSKQGKKGRLNITYDGYYGVQDLTNKPNLLTGAEFYQFKKTRLNADQTISAGEQAVYDAGAGVDWYSLATRQGSKTQHSITVAGGGDKVSYYLGGTYLNVQGVSVNDQFKRYSLRPSVTINIKPWLTIGSSSQLSFQDRTGLPVEFDDTRNTGGGANFFNPLTTPYNPDGSIALYAYPDASQARNPLSFILVKNLDYSYRLFTSNNIKLDIPFIKGLYYKLNTGVEYENVQRKTYYGRNVAAGYEVNGDAINYNSIDRNTTIENILNYSREFKKNSVNLTLLYSSQSEDFDRDQLEGIGFPNDVLTNYQMNSAALLKFPTIDPTNLANPNYPNFKQNLISQMARLNYGYNGRYLLTLTARRDGYSAFGAGKKYGVFPSAAVAWNVADEKFMQSLNFISSLKLRASYGVNGNQAVNSYSSLATLSSAPYISGSTVYPGYFPSTLANSQLSWESKNTLSFGLDFSILKNRVQGTIDYYSSKTRDLLLYRNISSVQGVTRILQNIGKTSNKGIDVGITSTNFKTKNFTWTTGANFSYNDGKIVDLYGDGKDDVGNKWFIGQPIRVAYGLQYDGIFRSTDEVAKSAQPTAQPGWVKIKDIDGNGVINTGSDRTILGNLDPKFLWGLTNTFKYKAFSLLVFLHGVGDVIKQDPFQDDNVFNTKRNTTKKDWWSPTNPDGTHFSNDANANKLGVGFYENASFARLKDVSLAYQLPAAIVDRLKITSLKVYVTGRNLATITKYQALDPELTNQNGLPLQKEFILGLTLGL